jgi:hypothetical protein
MRRRAALQALAALCAGLPRCAAAGRDALPILAWGPQGAWLAHASGTVQAFSASVPPVPVAAGWWSTGPGATLQRWQPDGADGWTAAARATFDDTPHALAATADGRHALVAHGERLSLLDAASGVLRVFDGRDLAGRRHGRAHTLFALAQRSSFVATWPALGEIWEISLDPAAAPIFDGLVHDYRMGEGLARPGHLGARRTPLGLPLPQIEFADARLPWVAGRDASGVVIVHLDARRRVATLPLAGTRPGLGVLRNADDDGQWWLPAADGVHVIDARRWTVRATHAAPQPVLALAVLGDRVGLLAGNPAELLVWQGNRWQRIAQPEGGATALGVDAAAGHWLLASAAPAALHRLDAAGRTLARWALPALTRIDGVSVVQAS